MCLTSALRSCNDLFGPEKNLAVVRASPESVKIETQKTRTLCFVKGESITAVIILMFRSLKPVCAALFHACNDTYIIGSCINILFRYKYANAIKDQKKLMKHKVVR